MTWDLQALELKSRDNIKTESCSVQRPVRQKGEQRGWDVLFLLILDTAKVLIKWRSPLIEQVAQCSILGA